MNLDWLTGMHMRHHIDILSVFRGMVAVEGWSESGAPVVLYNNKFVDSHTFSNPRDDLNSHFGQSSSEWGFSLRSIIGSKNVSHDAISLLFPDGTRIDAPGSKFKSSEDEPFGRMLRKFRELSEAGGRALEIGSRARSGNTYRHFIAPSVDYIGLDITAGPNVDVVGDAHHLSRYISNPIDYVFSISVFEHLLMPWKAAIEMNKVMNVGGFAYIQSHPTWPLHEEPWDFWRYSENAWEGIFNAHTGFKVLDKGCAMKAKIVADFAQGGHMQAHDDASTFLLSACLVEKIGTSKVEWDAEVSQVYDLGYNHA